MRFMLPIVFVVLASACAEPVALPEERVAAVAQASISCAVASDCPLEWKECLEAVCVAGICDVAQKSVGAPCTSGVGVCLEDQTCKPPVGACKAQDAPTTCASSSDCVDLEGCTWGECVGGLCRYTQDSNGSLCAMVGGACNWGACCTMPTGACEIPPSRGGPCLKDGECNDNHDCTWDSCEQGLCQHAQHPNGTYCTVVTGDDGQCLAGSCCMP